MKSSLYFGEVRHHRRSPQKHDLSYKLFMPHLFLDELDEVFKGRWLWSVDRSNFSSFHRKDYHNPKVSSLEKAVRATMSEQTGQEVKGPISVLTHLRTFGHCFNPVTFYYAWDDEKSQPHALMAEITNTRSAMQLSSSRRSSLVVVTESSRSGLPCNCLAMAWPT